MEQGGKVVGLLVVLPLLLLQGRGGFGFGMGIKSYEGLGLGAFKWGFHLWRSYFDISRLTKYLRCLELNSRFFQIHDI